jgi:hypothetical protein
MFLMMYFILCKMDTSAYFAENKIQHSSYRYFCGSTTVNRGEPFFLISPLRGKGAGGGVIDHG